MRRHSLVLVLGLAAAGCGGDGGSNTPTGSSSSSANRAPVTPTIGLTPAGVALANVTRVSLNATTTDPDGDALGYVWTWGDGTGNGSGALAEHIFPAGTFQVAVTINDGKGGTATATTTVTSRTIAGSWTDVDPRYGVTFSQTLGACGGTVYAGGGWGPVGAIESCTLSHPRNIAFFRRTFYPGVFAQCSYTGTLDDTGTRMTVRCSTETSFSLRRDNP